MTASKSFNARKVVFGLSVIAMLLLSNAFMPLSLRAEERVGPYDGKTESTPVDPNWNALLRSVWSSRNNKLEYNQVHKTTDKPQPYEAPKGIVNIIWNAVLDLVGMLVGLLWDLAVQFVRPMVQSLIEHVLTLLHNPNVASTLDDRTMPFGGLKSDAAKVPYDLVDKDTKIAVRQGFEFCRAIAINLLLLLFLVSIWKYWTEAAWRNGHNLMGAVGRLIATTALILGWPILSFYLVEISNEMIDYMFKSIDYAALNLAITRIVALGATGTAMALFTSVASGVISVSAGPAGIFVAGFGGAIGGLIYFLFLGVTIYETVYLIVLKAVQTILMLAQFMFAPIFLMFFALPDTERIASTFIKSCIEVSLWTFFWAGFLRLLVIVIQPGDTKTIWGQGIMLLGVLQLMIQVPAFMAHAQISPVSEFLTPRGAMNGVGSIFAGAGQLAKALTEAHKQQNPDNKHSQNEAPKPPSFHRGDNGSLGEGGPDSRPPPKFGNPQGAPTSKSPADIGRMNAKELAGLMQRHALNDEQSRAARARLASLFGSGDPSTQNLSGQEFAALAPLMGDEQFAAALNSSAMTPAHLAALASAPLSEQKREALKQRLNRCSAAEIAGLTPRQLAAVGPLLNATDDLANALAADPQGADKLAALLPTLSAAGFDNMVGNPALRGKFDQFTPRQLAQFNGDQLGKIGRNLSDSKLMDPSVLQALTPDQLKGMEGAYNRLSPDQKKALVPNLNRDQIAALGSVLLPAHSIDDLAALRGDKLSGFADHLSEGQLRNLGGHADFNDDKLAALTPTVKDANKLQALAEGLRANPKVKDFKPETLAQMYGGLNGEQISALTPALSLDAAKVKAISSALKTPDQISRFAAAIEDDAELCSTLVNELSLESCASLPGSALSRLTPKELDSMSPLKLAAIAPRLGRDQIATIGNHKLAEVAAALSEKDRSALVDSTPAWSETQRGILAPAKPVTPVNERKSLSLREAIDHIAQAIDDEDVFVTESSGGGFHAEFDRRGKLHIQMPSGVDRVSWASFISQTGLAQMMFYHPGARNACASAYESGRGSLDPSIHSTDPKDQPRIVDGMWKQAMIGAKAYLEHQPGNQFTELLSMNTEPLTDQLFGGEIQRMIDPTVPDNPFSRSYFHAKEICSQAGMASNSANIARVLELRAAGVSQQAVQNAGLVTEVSDYLSRPGSEIAYAAQASRVLAPSEVTAQRISWVQRFMEDGNNANRLRSVVDVDLIGEIYSAGGTVGSEVLGKSGTISDFHHMAEQLQQSHCPSYASPGLRGGMPAPRLVVGQATYQFLLGKQAAFEPDYKQFDQPVDVPAMSTARMQEVLPIYFRAGLTHEDLSVPDVAYSIQAIDAYNPELHAKLATGLRTVGAAPGVSPGLALVVDQAERYGHTKVSNDILIATEYNMKQREMAAGSELPTRREIMNHLETNNLKVPLKSYS